MEFIHIQVSVGRKRLGFLKENLLYQQPIKLLECRTNWWQFRNGSKLINLITLLKKLSVHLLPLHIRRFYLSHTNALIIYGTALRSGCYYVTRFSHGDDKARQSRQLKVYGRILSFHFIKYPFIEVLVLWFIFCKDGFLISLSTIIPL